MIVGKATARCTMKRLIIGSPYSELAATASDAFPNWTLPSNSRIANIPAASRLACRLRCSRWRRCAASQIAYAIKNGATIKKTIAVSMNRSARVPRKPVVAMSPIVLTWQENRKRLFLPPSQGIKKTARPSNSTNSTPSPNETLGTWVEWEQNQGRGKDMGTGVFPLE